MASLPERITIPITLDITVRTGMDTSPDAPPPVGPLGYELPNPAPHQPLPERIGQAGSVRVIYIHGPKGGKGPNSPEWRLIGADLGHSWDSSEDWQRACRAALNIYGEAQPFYLLTPLRRVAPEPLTVVDADGPMTDARRHALPRITVLHLRRGRAADLNQPGMPGWLLMRATWDPKGSPRIAHDGIAGGIAAAAEFILGDPREHDSVDECDAYLISPAQS